MSQRLIPWIPAPALADKRPSLGEIEIGSLDFRMLRVSLPYEEGKLVLQFNDVRAFLTIWDGDPDPFLDHIGPWNNGVLAKVEGSRWLAAGNFNLEIDPWQASPLPWEHFYILASERSLHVAAREAVAVEWLSGVWSGEPARWIFTPDPGQSPVER